MSMERKWSHKISRFHGINFDLLIIFTLLITPTNAFEDIGSIECDATLERIVQIQKTDCDEVTAQCPTSCHIALCRVTGSDPYTDTSSVCCAAIHKGILNSDDQSITIQISRKPRHLFFGTTKNGIKSKQHLRSTFLWFKFKDVLENTTPTVTTSSLLIPTTTTTQYLKTSKVAETVPSSVIYTKYDYNNLAQNEVFTPTSRHQIETSTPHTPKRRQYNQTRNPILPDAIKQKILEFTESSSSTTQANLGNEHLLGLRSSTGMILLLIGVFFAGVVSTVLLYCIVKRKRRITQRVLRTCGGSGSKKQKNMSQRFEDGNVCVCYQNLNSSKQGLLYDPETCERPCPIRNPNNEEDAMLRENSFMHHNSSLDYDGRTSCTNDGMLGKNPSHPKGTANRSSKRNSKCLQIAYEDECVASCSGACNPQQYDF
ncbi:uncharacterized protein LOC120326112 [Styela clava]